LKARAGIAVICALGTILLVLAPGAAAEGGASIASAPVVTSGQQEFGNTASGPLLEDGHGPKLFSFWRLPVTSGDEVTIDWESTNSSALIHLFPVGTNDFNFDPGSRPQQRQGVGIGDRNEFQFTATETGEMPLVFTTHGPDGGPYSFTAFVKHALVLALPHIATLPHKETIRVGVHNPEGGVVSDPTLRVAVEARRSGQPWKTIGKAIVVNSLATIHAKVPRSFWSGNLALRATASGTSYVKTRSSIRHVSVP
jgi:hypothetical protein